MMSANFAQWRRNVERTWADRYDFGFDFTATWVVPQPPPAHGQDHMPHLILEQHHVGRSSHSD